MLWILLELEDNENAENIYRTVTATVIVRYFFINRGFVHINKFENV